MHDLIDQGIERLGGDHALHQPRSQSLVRVQQPAGQQQVRGECNPDQPEHGHQFRQGEREAQFAHWGTEPATARRQAHIADTGDLQPTAHATALDGGDDRLRRIADGLQGRSDDLEVITASGGHIEALPRKLGDVGARGEIAAGTAQHDAMDVVPQGQFCKGLSQLMPGLDTQGVLFVWRIEGDTAHGPFRFIMDRHG